jgi:DNA-binding NarL/FixJ family response regulator
LLADDHEVVRRGLQTLLEAQPGWKVVGEAATGREAAEKAKLLTPDVVVLDIGMPEMNGLEAARRILETTSRVEILILTMHESEEVVREVLEAGARGYVLKSDAGRDLVAAIDALSQHKTFFTSRVAELVLQSYLEHRGAQGEEVEARVPRLTAREREVIQLLAEGKTNKEVAAMLDVSVKTVETHRANIMHKLALPSFSELVRYAIRNKIIEG